MNLSEREIWARIGEEKTQNYYTPSGRLKERKLGKAEIARLQRRFFDERCGQGVVGDEWMRREVRRRGSVGEESSGGGMVEAAVEEGIVKEGIVKEGIVEDAGEVR